MGAAIFVMFGFSVIFAGSSRSLYADRQARLPHQDKSALGQPVYWLIVICFGLIAGGEAAFVTLIPAYYEKVRHLSGEFASMLLAVHLAGLMAGRFASAYLGRKLSNNATIAICLAAGVFVAPAMVLDNWFLRGASLFLFGVMFSATWPTFYAQVSGRMRPHMAMLAYGSSLGTSVGVSVCYFISSLIADRSLSWSVVSGPAVLWLFGAIYFASSLSRTPAAQTDHRAGEG